jgi:hypothetical protein
MNFEEALRISAQILKQAERERGGIRGLGDVRGIQWEGDLVA